MKALVGQEDAPKALRLNDRSVLNRTSLDVAWMMSGAGSQRFSCLGCLSRKDQLGFERPPLGFHKELRGMKQP